MALKELLFEHNGAATRPLRWSLRHGLARRYFARAASQGSPFARIALTPALQADPFETYEEIRAQGPRPAGRAAGVFVDHAAVGAALRSDAFRVSFSNDAMPWIARAAIAGSVNKKAIGPADPPSMLVIDPPLHTAHRKLVSGVFTARAIEGLRPRVEEIADELLSGLAREHGTVDLMARYASLLPVTVIGEILGVPKEMHQRVLQWGRDGAPSLDIGLKYRDFRRVDRTMAESNTWMRGHLQRLRREPGDDLTSRLVRKADEEGVGETELVAIAGLVLAAGFETTVNLIGNGTRQLLRHPEQRELLRADPSLWGNAVEEILRFDSPVQNTARIAIRDTELDGHPVASGSLVMLVIGAANRDPKVFTDPAVFDITRANAREHLAFSSGIHFCLGAALARVEGVAGLQRLFERFPDLASAGVPERRRTRILRGYATQPVTLGRVPASA